jgi:hypothetical protein
MLKVREKVTSSEPEVLNSSAVAAYFDRLRAKLPLPNDSRDAPQPDVDPAHWAECAQRAGAQPVQF